MSRRLHHGDERGSGDLRNPSFGLIGARRLLCNNIGAGVFIIIQPALPRLAARWRAGSGVGESYAVSKSSPSAARRSRGRGVREEFDCVAIFGGGESGDGGGGGADPITRRYGRRRRDI